MPATSGLYSGRMDAPRTRRSDRQELVDLQFQTDADYWNDLYDAPTLDGRVYRDRQERVLRLLDRARLRSGAVVLDVGCGAGFLTAALAASGHRVIALDPVDRMLDLTRKRLEEEALADQVTVRIGDAQALDLADGSVDAALAIGVLPWLRSPEDALVEFARVLRPGGYVVVTVDNEARLAHLLDPRLNPYAAPVRRRVKVLPRRRRAPAGEAVHSFAAPRELDRLLEATGFRKRASASVGFAPLSFWGRPVLRGRAGERLHDALQRHADRGVPILRSLGAHYIVLGEKA
jgi:ubiquinone/menaquinone biosynthesis C-methylase UbiE